MGVPLVGLLGVGDELAVVIVAEWDTDDGGRLAVGGEHVVQADGDALALVGVEADREGREVLAGHLVGGEDDAALLDDDGVEGEGEGLQGLAELVQAVLELVGGDHGGWPLSQFPSCWVMRAMSRAPPI